VRGTGAQYRIRSIGNARYVHIYVIEVYTMRRRWKKPYCTWQCVFYERIDWKWLFFRRVMVCNKMAGPNTSNTLAYPSGPCFPRILKRVCIFKRNSCIYEYKGFKIRWKYPFFRIFGFRRICRFFHTSQILFFIPFIFTLTPRGFVVLIEKHIYIYNKGINTHIYCEHYPFWWIM